MKTELNQTVNILLAFGGSGAVESRRVNIDVCDA
jgi:hypothetical protein